MHQLQDKSDQAEVTSALSNFTSDNTQRMLDIRNEIMSRLTDSLNHITDAIRAKASMDDLRRIAEDKVDLSMFKSTVQQRVSFAEFESFK